MTTVDLLDQMSGEVKAEDFHTVCQRLGQFAVMQAAAPQRLPAQSALLHGPHPSGLTLFYITTHQFAPRRHGAWCIVAPLHEPVAIENWTEYIPPAEFTGSLRAHAAPDVHYHCDVGDGLFIPEGQLFAITAEHRVEVLLLCGEHPNHTWPESRIYISTQHAERTLMYPETPISGI